MKADPFAPAPPASVSASKARGKARASATKSKDKKQLLTGEQSAIKGPRSKRQARPPGVPGYVWRSSGAGWELRRLVTEDGRRRQPYVAYLAKSVYQDMKRSHRSRSALAAALAGWVSDREGKGIA